MWSVIELRLRRRSAWLLAIYAASWILGGSVVLLFPALKSPEGVAMTTGLLALAMVYFLQSVAGSNDSRERREAFHYTLPVRRSSLDAARLLEPLVLPFTLTALNLGIAGLTRLAQGGELRWQELWLLAAGCVAIMLFEQLQIFFTELKRRLVTVVALAVVTVFLCLAAVGVFGTLLNVWTEAFEETMPLYYVLFARPQLVAGVLVATALLTELNRRLLAARREFVD